MHVLRGCAACIDDGLTLRRLKRHGSFPRVLSSHPECRSNERSFSLPLSLFSSLSPSLRKAFTRHTLDYQRASLQQKLLAAVSRIESRSIDRWRGASGWNCAPRRTAADTDNIDDGQRRLGIPNRQLRDKNDVTSINGRSASGSVPHADPACTKSLFPPFFYMRRLLEILPRDLRAPSASRVARPRHFSFRAS